jgi:DNA repair ATPase RecN
LFVFGVACGPRELLTQPETLVATYADARYKVHKEELGARIISMLQALESEARIKEIAVMLAGPQ